MAEARIEYEPRDAFIPFHQRSQRWSCMVVHRRAGKTVACVNDLGAKALYTPKKDARYAYIAPFYRQAKDVAWTYLKSFLEPVITRARESELRVELVNGSWITLYGADNPDALRGLYLDGVILDEFGDCRPSLWGSVVLPTLIDRGGWAVFIGTPRGKNQFYKIHKRAQVEPGWFNILLPASKSGIISEEELAEIRAQQSEDEYEQEMECSFDAALLGTYYAKAITAMESEGRYTPLAHVPSQPVYVSADLGRSDSTAFWFWQERPDGLAFLDYEEHHGQDLDFYIKLLKEKPYKYERIWLPWDAKAKTLATKRTTIEQMRDAGFPVMPGPKLAIQDRIEATRYMLPRCWFNSDSPNVGEGLDVLRSYRRRYSEMQQAFVDKPNHDWASHGADAFGLFALVSREQAPKSKSAPRLATTVSEDPNTYGFSLDDLWKDRDARHKAHKHEILRIN